MIFAGGYGAECASPCLSNCAFCLNATICINCGRNYQV